MANKSDTMIDDLSEFDNFVEILDPLTSEEKELLEAQPFGIPDTQITDRETPPITPNVTFMPEINRIFEPIAIKPYTPYDEPLFEWMERGKFNRTRDNYTEWDVFVDPNLFPNIPDGNDLYYNSELRERASTPYFNPAAVFIPKHDGTNWSDQEKLALRCVPSHDWYRYHGDGEDYYKRHEYKDMDERRNWRFRPWLEKGCYVSRYDNNLHKVRDDYTDKTVTMPKSRMDTIKLEYEFEIESIYDDDYQIQNKTAEYCAKNGIVKDRRQFKDEEQGAFTCSFCHCVSHLSVMCQNENHEIGKHLYCYPCVKQLIIEREMQLCCEINTVECPVRCGRYLRLRYNQRPPLAIRYKIAFYFEICYGCKGRFTSMHFKNHLLNCVDVSDKPKTEDECLKEIKRYQQKIKQLNKDKKDAENALEELKSKREIDLRNMLSQHDYQTMKMKMELEKANNERSKLKKQLDERSRQISNVSISERNELHSLRNIQSKYRFEAIINNNLNDDNCIHPLNRITFHDLTEPDNYQLKPKRLKTINSVSISRQTSVSDIYKEAAKFVSLDSNSIEVGNLLYERLEKTPYLNGNERTIDQFSMKPDWHLIVRKSVETLPASVGLRCKIGPKIQLFDDMPRILLTPEEKQNRRKRDAAIGRSPYDTLSLEHSNPIQGNANSRIDRADFTILNSLGHKSSDQTTDFQLNTLRRRGRGKELSEKIKLCANKK